MSDYGAAPSTCVAVEDHLAEFALGALSGRERQTVLAHLEGCDRCRAEVEQLALTADSILQASPRIEPPLGFEQRVADRMRPPPAVPRQPWFRRFRAVLAVAAAVVLLALGVGIGVAAAPGGSPAAPPSASPRSAPLLSGGEVYGHVVTYDGHGPQPPWLSMTLRGAEWSGQVTCQVTVRGGTVVTVGTFWLHQGTGSWDAPLPVAADRVTGARVMGAGGRMIAAAVLRA